MDTHRFAAHVVGGCRDIFELDVDEKGRCSEEGGVNFCDGSGELVALRRADGIFVRNYVERHGEDGRRAQGGGMRCENNRNGTAAGEIDRASNQVLLSQHSFLLPR